MFAKAVLLAVVGLASANNSLTLKAGSTDVVVNLESGGALKFAATCIDRSNWCGTWADTACTAGASVAKGSRVSLGSDAGPTLQAYQDGTLAFENLGGECVGIDMSTPTAAQLLESNQVVFGTTGRVYKDTAGKMWIQAASLQDSNGAITN
jgi:hypothetical protein